MLRWALVPRATQGPTQAGGWLAVDQASRGVDLTLRRAGVGVGGAQQRVSPELGAKQRRGGCARTLCGRLCPCADF